MHENHAHEHEPRRHAEYTGMPPSSSRMLTSYLADIEQLLDEQRWEAAVREAFDLPQIAVALGDPQLRVSGERLKAWCREWISPVESEHGESVASDDQRVCEIVCERAEQDSDSEFETVPALALRRLRLRRLVRTPPRGFSSDHAAAAADPEGADAVEISTTLVEAARRWYAHSACHDPTVQANLARLAVLR
jgi:hypothetical protein